MQADYRSRAWSNVRPVTRTQARLPGNVEFDVPAGTAKAICAFYPSIMGMPAEFLNGDNAVACVKAGKDQYLQFRETDRALPEFDGHHDRSTSRVPTIACGSAA